MGAKVEVSFSPVLYPYKLIKKDFVVVVVDILRATTSICAALHYGIKEIIPVSGIEEAKQCKEKGLLVACENNGATLDFADIGNSPSDFLQNGFIGKTIAFSTTNGTMVINQAKQDADKVLIGSFINLTALSDYLISLNKNVVVLCSAWKNLFNLEDSIFAGALSQSLIQAGFITECDSAKAAIDLWDKAKVNLGVYLDNSSHRNRLRHLVSDEDYVFTVSIDISDVVPGLEGHCLKNVSTAKKGEQLLNSFYNYGGKS
jgi:2-phosphosulfolactate phosphatase